MSARAVRFAATGGPDVLRLETIDAGQPGDNEILIRQTAVGSTSSTRTTARASTP